MVPQPTAKSSLGETPLDRLLACHQWLALGFGADPASMLSGRDFAILEALGAQFIALNPPGPVRSGRSSVLECGDAKFIAWARKHSVRAILIRPDRFIAARLDASVDLSVLNPFAMAPAAALPRAA
jgi:3-(3-hydroxy-phenyl)propionate hydroxylase